MKIRLICLGNLKEEYWRAAVAEYAKRLSKSCTLEVIELPEAPIPKPGTPAQIQAGLEAEGEKILSRLTGGYTIALCVEGKALNSEQFAEKIGSLMSSGVQVVNIVIGSSHGLSPRIKQCADLRLSVSAMTLPHQMARVFLLEQLYRAFDILGPRKYDK